jgi:hypothetical protein
MYDPDDELNFARGCIYSAVMSVPFWMAIAVIAVGLGF